MLYLRNEACFAHLVQLLEGANSGAIINLAMKIIETESKDLRGVCRVGSCRETPFDYLQMMSWLLSIEKVMSADQAG